LGLKGSYDVWEHSKGKPSSEYRRRRTMCANTHLEVERGKRKKKYGIWKKNSPFEEKNLSKKKTK